jgi:hypothetical protein
MVEGDVSFRTPDTGDPPSQRELGGNASRALAESVETRSTVAAFALRICGRAEAYPPNGGQIQRPVLNNAGLLLGGGTVRRSRWEGATSMLSVS